MPNPGAAGSCLSVNDQMTADRMDPPVGSFQYSDLLLLDYPAVGNNANNLVILGKGEATGPEMS